MSKGKHGNKEVKKPKKAIPVVTTPVPGLALQTPSIGVRMPPRKK